MHEYAAVAGGPVKVPAHGRGQRGARNHTSVRQSYGSLNLRAERRGRFDLAPRPPNDTDQGACGPPILDNTPRGRETGRDSASAASAQSAATRHFPLTLSTAWGVVATTVPQLPRCGSKKGTVAVGFAPQRLCRTDLCGWTYQVSSNPFPRPTLRPAGFSLKYPVKTAHPQLAPAAVQVGTTRFSFDRARPFSFGKTKENGGANFPVPCQGTWTIQ